MWLIWSLINWLDTLFLRKWVKHYLSVKVFVYYEVFFIQYHYYYNYYYYYKITVTQLFFYLYHHILKGSAKFIMNLQIIQNFFFFWKENVLNFHEMYESGAIMWCLGTFLNKYSYMWLIWFICSIISWSDTLFSAGFLRLTSINILLNKCIHILLVLLLHFLSFLS